MENILGFKKGYLKKGAIIYGILKKPNDNEFNIDGKVGKPNNNQFNLAGDTRFVDGKIKESDDKKTIEDIARERKGDSYIDRMKTEARSSWSYEGRDRLVKVKQLVSEGSGNMWIEGSGAPQWQLTKKFAVVELATLDPGDPLRLHEKDKDKNKRSKNNK